MNTAEKQAHEALTRVTAALDWMHKAAAGEGWTGNWNAALNNAALEMREAQAVLKALWVDCNDCGDRTWTENMGTTDYGDRVCQGCLKAREDREPSDHSLAEYQRDKAAGYYERGQS